MHTSRKPALHKFRRLYIDAPIAQLEHIKPNQAITPAEHNALKDLINAVNTLWKMTDHYDDELERMMHEALPAKFLISLYMKHPEHPGVIWDAFVMWQTEYLEQQSK